MIELNMENHWYLIFDESDNYRRYLRDLMNNDMILYLLDITTRIKQRRGLFVVDDYSWDDYEESYNSTI